MDKKQLRSMLQRILTQQITGPDKRKKSQQACRYLVETPEFEAASTVMMYLAIPDETDVTDAIVYSWQKGKRVVVPKILWQEKYMVPVQIDSLEASPIELAISGLRNPVNSKVVGLEEIDLVVAPGLGFDNKGNRLGRGGAYYDRFFADEKLTAGRCGIAFTEQVVDYIPATADDKRVDFLVTDAGVTYFNSD